MSMDERRAARCLGYIHVTDGCWEWTGPIDGAGRGVFFQSRRHRPRSWVAHRAVWTLLVGPLDDELQLDHLCLNKACVNPAHLEPVTGQENARRYFALITHCPQGHEYTDANTYYRRADRGDGYRHRQCRMCAKEKARARRAAASLTQPPMVTLGETA